MARASILWQSWRLSLRTPPLPRDRLSADAPIGNRLDVMAGEPGINRRQHRQRCGLSGEHELWRGLEPVPGDVLKIWCDDEIAGPPPGIRVADLHDLEASTNDLKQ